MGSFSDLLSSVNMSSVKIFKKSAPNGGVTIYMGQREFVSVDGKLDPIAGVAQMPDAKGRFGGKCVFASLVCMFRHGRKEDETMGVSFSKEIVVDRQTIFPNNQAEGEETRLQAKMLQKFGEDARRFNLKFPKNAPNSVHITGYDGDVADMGVAWEVRVHVGDHAGDFNDKKESTASMTIRKTQWAPADKGSRSPTGQGDKSFVGSKGKLSCEVNLDKEMHYHGDEIPVHIALNNTTSKSVNSMKVTLVQHCELTMVKNSYTCKVSSIETTDGCPLGPENSLKKTVNLQPLAQTAKFKKGLAIDHALSSSGDEANLASTSYAESGNPNDLLGVVVSYSIRVTLDVSGMTGKDLQVEVPIKLHHPRPDESARLHEIKDKSAAQSGIRNEFKNKFPHQESVSVENF